MPTASVAQLTLAGWGGSTAADACEFYALTPERVGEADEGVAVFAGAESAATQSEAVA